MTQPPHLEYTLLNEFERLFQGRIYRHRSSTQGDFLALQLYEDLVSIKRSPKLIEAVSVRRDRVAFARNTRRGIQARRGDGSFGELIPGETALTVAGFEVSRGPIATLEIGVEVKILAKAMMKQIGRVTTVLRGQAAQFRRGGDKPILRRDRRNQSSRDLHQPRGGEALAHWLRRTPAPVSRGRSG